MEKVCILQKMNKFITFEGGEGTGKSTQAKLLLKSIKNSFQKATLTREPGGSKTGEQIRKIIVQKKYRVHSLTELLLIYASRNENLNNIIIPKLKNKEIVICDRYIDSTFVYQIMGKNISKSNFEYLNKLIVEKYIPKITFVLDIDPKIGIERSLKIKREETKYEELPIKFHQNLRKSFVDLSKKKKRIRLLDGNRPIKEIHKEIITIVNNENMFKKLEPIKFNST